MNFYNIKIVLKSIQESSKEMENQQTSLIFYYFYSTLKAKPVFFSIGDGVKYLMEPFIKNVLQCEWKMLWIKKIINLNLFILVVKQF